MSYSLTPIIVDLKQLRKLMGSKDTTILKAVFQAHHKELLGTDEGFDEFFIEFKKEIKAEYKAFVAGDYSGVDLNAKYPERKEDDEDDEDDEETRAFMKEYNRLKKKDPKAADEFMKQYVMKAFLEDDGDDEYEEEEEEEDLEPQRSVSTGAALVHLIMGGKPDPSLGFKYGYALYHLCETLGEIPDHDSWCSIRWRTLEWIDAFFKKAGIKRKQFSIEDLLATRGPPVKMPRPDDFPAIGYVELGEMPAILKLLDPAKMDPLIAKAAEDDQEWLTGMVSELRTWLKRCLDTKRDLICFYS
jgi:hypothetical protein